MIVATTHGYVRDHALGGEVALHRTLVALNQPVTVLTRTAEPFDVDGIRVEPIGFDDVLNVNADPAPIIRWLAKLDASAVITQNELSLPTVKAARILGIPSIVSVHTPPRFGKTFVEAVSQADAVVYNTKTSAELWGEPDALVVHPPTGNLPPKPITSPQGDAYTMLSNLRNKGVRVVLDMARRMPDQRFIIVRSPAEITHGLPQFDELAAELPNVEVHPRVAPDEVADRYLSQTRILLVPSWYETYGMSAIEAAGYGIPSVHVDTPHVREGIGEAAELIPPLNVDATYAALNLIEDGYSEYSVRVRARAEWLAERQTVELEAWADWVSTITVLDERERVRRTRIQPSFRR